MRLFGTLLCIAALSFLFPLPPFPTGMIEGANQLRVYGYVRDAATGVSIGSAIVTASRPVRVVGLQTHGNGVYSLYLPAGSYTLTAVHAGYAGQSKPLVLKTRSVQLNFSLHAQTNSQEPLPSPPPTSSNAIPQTLFGMHEQQINDGFPPAPIGPAVGAIGKGSLVVWPYVQQSCPNHVAGRDDCPYDWANNDAYVNFANSRGLDIFFSSELVPPWAALDPTSCGPTYTGSPYTGCLSTVSDLRDWDNFVYALVTRYDGQHEHGRILAYECWNEPDIPSEWKGTAIQLVALCNHMHDIIRAHDAAIGANPPTLFLAPSTLPSTNEVGWIGGSCPSNGCNDLDTLLNSGMTTDFDVATWHFYYTVPEPAVGYIQDLRRVLTKHGVGMKPVWNTEGSWGTYALTDDQQVAFVGRAYLLYWSNQVSRFYWYAWDNAAWGALWNGSTVSPAGIAYGQVRTWLVGSVMNVPCSANVTVWTCGLMIAAGLQTQAVWNTSGSSVYSVPAGFGHYQDLAGNTTAISGGTVTIGIQPILLTP